MVNKHRVEENSSGILLVGMRALEVVLKRCDNSLRSRQLRHLRTGLVHPVSTSNDFRFQSICPRSARDKFLCHALHTLLEAWIHTCAEELPPEVQIDVPQHPVTFIEQALETQPSLLKRTGNDQ